MVVLALVPFLKATEPVLVEAVPRVREEAPVRVAAVNWGEALVLIPWIVLITPLAAEKLVALNWAIPLAEVEASSIVTVLPAPEELAIVKAPVRLSSEVTPPWAEIQAPQLKT